MHGTALNSVLSRFGLAIWAMTTLVLCFVVILLVNEMLKEGANPLAAFRPESETFPEEVQSDYRTPSSLGTREIVLHFATQDGRALAAETVVIEYNARTVENCRKAIEHLISGPRQSHLLPTLPQESGIRALYLLDNGELVLDLSSEMLLAQHRAKSAEMEALMAYSIANTISQPALQGEDEQRALSLRFLFDGATPQEAFPAHMDLSAPITPDRRWIQAGLE